MKLELILAGALALGGCGILEDFYKEPNKPINPPRIEEQKPEKKPINPTYKKLDEKVEAYKISMDEFKSRDFKNYKELKNTIQHYQNEIKRRKFIKGYIDRLNNAIDYIQDLKYEKGQEIVDEVMIELMGSKNKYANEVLNKIKDYSYKRFVPNKGEYIIETKKLK